MRNDFEMLKLLAADRKRREGESTVTNDEQKAAIRKLVDRALDPKPAPRVGDWMQTYTGKCFYPFDPRPEDVSIDDIAHHLALVNRFNGATSVPWSVAAHSLLCMDIARGDGCSPRTQLYCLLHDAAEAYLNDVIRPIKRSVYLRLPGAELGELNLMPYDLVEKNILDAIYVALHIPPPTVREQYAVRIYDGFALAVEHRDLLADCDVPWGESSDLPKLNLTKPWRYYELAFKNELALLLDADTP